MSNWQIRIQSPSGVVKTLAIDGALSLGRDSTMEIALADATVAPHAATLYRGLVPRQSPYRPVSNEGSNFWLRTAQDAPPIRVGDLVVREAHLPADLPVTIGETCLVLQREGLERPVPEAPIGLRAWLTASISGREALWMARKAAQTPLSIYIAGETGTGKEVIARLMHAWSARASGPFVPLHCGALPLSLAESELFGHVKGAFTGAAANRAGALMQAHGGTLFLDEIADLPLDIQVKLLRFLEDGELRPVGADRASRADVRLLCATHQALHELVEQGRFRRDLYYRLASVTIALPALRDRPEDIELLAARFASDMGRSITERAMLRLKSHAWPGNVRELRHAVERASGLAGPFSPLLAEEAFEFLVTPENVARAPQLELGAAVITLAEMERLLLVKTLKLTGGNRRRAAETLGIARSTLFEKLKHHGIPGVRS